MILDTGRVFLLVYSVIFCVRTSKDLASMMNLTGSMISFARMPNYAAQRVSGE